MLRPVAMNNRQYLIGRNGMPLIMLADENSIQGTLKHI